MMKATSFLLASLLLAISAVSFSATSARTIASDITLYAKLPFGLKPEDLVNTYIDKISANTTQRQQQQQQRDRSLTIGDFAGFNLLFQNAQLLLPDQDLNNGLTLHITNIICTNLNLGPGHQRPVTPIAPGQHRCVGSRPVANP